jgi:NinB protein
LRLTRTITETNRAELMAALKAAPVGSVFELVDDPRTLAQNRLMRRLLNEVSAQLPLGPDKLMVEPEDWKCVFMKTMGYQCRWVPALDGDGVVAVGYSSSRLTKEKFSDLIETIYSQGLQRGVVFPG